MRYRLDSVPRMFTAAQIAKVEGVTPGAMRQQLASVEPDGVVVRSGNQAAAYVIEKLPLKTREKIAEQKINFCYRDSEAVLADPKPQWQPTIPLSKQPPENIERAHLLQRALAFFIEHRNDREIRPGELDRRLASDYEATFGKRVSRRHVARIAQMVILRDGGRNEFSRIELYLPAGAVRDDRPAAKQAGGIHPSLDDAISTVEDIAALSVADRACLWKAALDDYLTLVDQGTESARAKRHVVSFMLTRVPRIAASRHALRVAFDRKVSAFERDGIKGLCDKRRDGAAKRKIAAYVDPESLSEDERLLLTRANKVGGGLSQAFRELYCGIEIIPGKPMQFSEHFRSSYSFNPRLNKSYVPESLRAKLQPLLRSIKPLNQGPKAARLAEPSRRRDWSKVPSGKWYQSDDETANHYVWFEDESGEFEFDGLRFNVIRPQILPMVCTRTDLVLSVLLLPRPQYNSRDIRTLMLETCMDERIGLPFEGFAFERGIWKSRNVAAMVNWTEIDAGFARAGISLKIRNATTPKSKGIERLFSQEQNAMQELPGYTGRLEMKDCPELTRKSLAAMKRVGQPLKAEAAPWDHFLSGDQYLDLLQRAYERFNNEVQNGERLPGMSPEEGWKAFAPGRPHQVLPDSLRYLLATEQTESKVSREGIKIQIAGKPRFFFDSDRLGNLMEEKVIVRWNSSMPDHVVVVHPRTDPLGQRPFIVRHEPALDADKPTSEEFSAARARRKAFLKPQVSLFRMLNHGHNLTVRNELLGSAPLRQAGEAHNRVEREEIELRPAREAQATNARKLAHRAGLDPAKIKNTDRAAELQSFDELRARLREREQNAQDQGHLPAKGKL